MEAAAAEEKAEKGADEVEEVDEDGGFGEGAGVVAKEGPVVLVTQVSVVIEFEMVVGGAVVSTENVPVELAAELESVSAVGVVVVSYVELTEF